jgi:hypothetical protein
MAAYTKRRSPTWQQALLLVIWGLVVGYPSCAGVTHGMGGGDVSRYQGCMLLVSSPASWPSSRGSPASF